MTALSGWAGVGLTVKKRPFRPGSYQSGRKEKEVSGRSKQSLGGQRDCKARSKTGACLPAVKEKPRRNQRGARVAKVSEGLAYVRRAKWEDEDIGIAGCVKKCWGRHSFTKLQWGTRRRKRAARGK